MLLEANYYALGGQLVCSWRPTTMLLEGENNAFSHREHAQRHFLMAFATKWNDASGSEQNTWVDSLRPHPIPDKFAVGFRLPYHLLRQNKGDNLADDTRLVPTFTRCEAEIDPFSGTYGTIPLAALPITYKRNEFCAISYIIPIFFQEFLLM